MRIWMAAVMGLIAGGGLDAQVIAQPGKSPLITIRIVFRTGSASDPKGKEGLTSLTASMLAEGGTRRMTYQQIVDALFPMATQVEWQVDKEMTTFSAETHADNLNEFHALLRDMLLDPGWRDEDLRRLKDDAVSYLRVSLRGNNDEELGKEALYQAIYENHPYRHPNAGLAKAIEKLTAGDLKEFYQARYTRANLTIAIAGGYPAGYEERLRKEFDKLPAGKRDSTPLPQPEAIKGRRLLMIEKDTRSVAMSMGFPLAVKRGDPDFVPLLVAQSWLGQHRNSGVRLYDRIREVRGLNYGDYAYIEYFPRGMFQFEPDPNLARRQQIFQVWIRPVEPETAHFTLRLAIHELERLSERGLTAEEFEKTRSFLSKYVNLLTRTKRAELGYAIDSRFYGIPEYNGYLKNALAKLTVADVNRAVKKHLSPANMQIVLVGKDCAALRDQIVKEAASPMKYNSAKPQEVLDEDQVVQKLPLRIAPEAVRIVNVDQVFE
ncbi:MAG: insulinase family protein [Candidatus Solibacter usitatus]|nr:insulinase family protein [Candidatus Solibacter usitatus]